MCRFACFAVVIGLFLASSLGAAEPSNAELAQKAQAVLRNHCYGCHGEGGQFDLFPGIVPDSPTAEVENIAGNRWRRFWLAGETPNDPERVTVHD